MKVAHFAKLNDKVKADAFTGGHVAHLTSSRNDIFTLTTSIIYLYKLAFRIKIAFFSLLRSLALNYYLFLSF